MSIVTATAIAPKSASGPTPHGLDALLRACVHCGFCNATCPPFPVSGSELEGRRGRLYLMKSVLQERIGLTAQVVEHLDNCLSCLSCETTCPSGVRYSHLIDPMRARIEEQFRRPPLHRLQRKALALLLPHPGRFRLALRLAGLARPLAPLLPRNLRAMVRMAPLRLPARSRLEGYEVHVAQGARKARVALLLGCAQRVVGPAINDATIRFLTRIGCEVVLPREVGCCGALVYHLGNHPDSLPLMKRAIDAWYAELMNGGLDYIVINTSGCGSVVRDYGHIFRDDPAWREKAARVSAIAKDFSEVVTELGLPEEVEPRAPEALRVAYHDPCSLQHGQKVRRQPRDLLQLVGFDVVDVPEGHLCCGSAGTYNLLKPEMGRTLGLRKAQAIGQVAPQAVATGNVGCMEQIAQYSPLPVVHTAELLDWATGGLQPKVLRRKA